MLMVSSKVKRSALYRLISSIYPVNDVQTANSDAWGAVIVMGLSVVLLDLVRLVLTH